MEAVQEDLHYWKHRALNVETVLKELMESLVQSQEENRIFKEKIAFHMKKKFELDQVPYALAKEIFKRMSITSLSRMRRTTKTMADYILQGRNSYIKVIPNILPSITPISTRFLPTDILFNLYVQGRQYYRFSSLEINDFDNDEVELRRVLNIFKDAHVYATAVSILNSQLLPEIFDYFKPINLIFVEKAAPLRISLSGSPHCLLTNIIGTVKNTETFTRAVGNLVGKSVSFELKATWNVEVKFEVIRTCMEILGKNEQRQRIKFTVPFMTTSLPPSGSGFYVHRGETVDSRGNYYCFVVYPTSKGAVVAQIGGKVYDMNSIIIVYCEKIEEFEEQFLKQTTMTAGEKTSLTSFMQTYFPRVQKVVNI